MQVRSRVLGSNLFLTGISGVGGGLVTLLHRTFLSFSLKGRGPHLSFLEGLLVCDCTLQDGTHLVLANVYLRPRQPVDEWTAIQSSIHSLGRLPFRPIFLLGGI